MAELDLITSEILSFPSEQRALLAEILIQSLDEPEESEVKTAWLTEIHRRSQEIRAGNEVCKPALEVLREARNELRCAR